MTIESQKLVDLLRMIPAAAVIVDQGNIIGTNPECIELTGIPRNRLVGSPLADLVVHEHQKDIDILFSVDDAHINHRAVRLANGLTPLELASKRITDRLVIVTMRSMASEHLLSAKAGGPLTHDSVTGLPNRHHLLEQLHQRLAAVPAKPIAIIAIWIDDLDQLKSERGSRVVERVSRQVGERIQNRLRGPDLLGRFDDSAFLALLTTDSDGEKLTIIADRLRHEVAFPVEFDGQLISFTASVTVAAIGSKRPSMELILSRLDTFGRQATSRQGNRTDILTF